MENFKCGTCQNVFSSKFNLDRHVAKKACAVKLNTNSVVGSNAALEIMMGKLMSIIRKEVFKLEETNEYDNKDEMIDILCEAMATNLQDYFSSKEQVNKKEEKKNDYEKKKNDVLKNGEENYKNNISKIKQLEGEIKINNELLRNYSLIENFKTMTNKIKIYRALDDSLFNKYTGWDEGEVCDFMEDITDLTMENLDKFHDISGGRTIDWLDNEFMNYHNEPKEIQELYHRCKYYINKKYRDKMDMSKNSDYFKNMIIKKKEMIDLLKTENDTLENEYFLYTERDNKGCGIMLSEICDPNYEDNIKQELERNKRLMAYKKSIAETNDD